MRMRGPSCLKQNLFFIALLYFRLFFLFQHYCYCYCFSSRYLIDE